MSCTAASAVGQSRMAVSQAGGGSAVDLEPSALWTGGGCVGHAPTVGCYCVTMDVAHFGCAVDVCSVAMRCPVQSRCK